MQPIIKIENLTKEYRLGQYSSGTLTADIQSWWAKIRSKEDPNRKLDDSTQIKNTHFLALDNVNLEIFKGDTIGIIGGNGAGKSTLLKVLARITAPTSGKIGFDGRISSMLEVGTGFSGEMTGRENIYMNGAILGMSKKEVASKIDNIIEFSECGRFIDTPVKRYSSGMYVKLAFAVAAHLDSEILIMDEVLAVGDMKFQHKCLTKMKSLATQEGRTVIYVSHNMDTIRKLCNRCVVIKEGKIVCDGNTESAVQIYLEAADEIETFYDLENSPRWVSFTRAQVISLSFYDRSISYYNAYEKVRIKIKWRANSDVQDIMIRFDIKTVDCIAVGVCYGIIGSGAKGEEYESLIEMDVSNFADGKYFFNLSIVENSLHIPTVAYDDLKKCIYFEVGQRLESAPTWNHSDYGHFYLEPLRLIDINKIARNAQGEI